MDVTVLGACGTWPGPSGATSGYLVRHDGHSLWVDAGSGTLASLQQQGSLKEVDAIVITHEHVDHCVDLLVTYYAIAYGDLAPRGVELYLPTGVLERLEGAVSASYRDTLRSCFTIHTLGAPDSFDVGPFQIEGVLMPHVGLTAFGYRITAGGATLAYTGDTGPGEALVQLAREADLLLTEAALQAADPPFDSHLTAAQAGEGASRAEAKRVILTHLRPNQDPAVSIREASDAYGGPIEVAVAGQTYEVIA